MGWVAARTGDVWMGVRAGIGWELGQGMGGSEDRGCMEGSEGRDWVGARTGDGWQRGQGMYGGE